MRTSRKPFLLVFFWPKNVLHVTRPSRPCIELMSLNEISGKFPAHPARARLPCYVEQVQTPGYATRKKRERVSSVSADPLHRDSLIVLRRDYRLRVLTSGRPLLPRAA